MDGETDGDSEEDEEDNDSTDESDEDEEDNRVRVVFIAEGEKANLVQVETGIADMDDIEIISGIEEGAEIITGSYRALTRELKNDSDIYLRKEEDKKDKKK